MVACRDTAWKGCFEELMNFTTWNKLLCDYFFSQSEAMTFLSIDKEELINLALQSQEFEKQLYLCGKQSYSIEEKKNYAWSDFIHIFGKSSENSWLCTKSILLDGLKRRIQESATNYEIPSVFPYIALFIIPLSNDPELNANAFYPKVNEFLRSEAILEAGESLATLDMAKINPGLDFMWNNLSEWATANGFIFNVVSRSTSGRAKYTSPFLSQLIFTASQRDNFKLVFYHAGLTPSQEINDEYAEKILSNHHSRLGVTKNRWDSIRKDYLSSALSIFFQELNAWDGIAVVQRKGDNYRQSEYLGVSQNLLLDISIYRGAYHFELRAKLPDASFGEDFSYESRLYGNYSFITDNNGVADEYMWNPEIQTSISKGETITFYKVGDKKTKLSYTPSEIELLEYSFGRYISTKNFQQGRKYLALINNDKLDNFSQWLINNSAEEVKRQDLSASHSLYFIKSAVSEITFYDVKRLHFETKKYIYLVDTIMLGKTDDAAILIYKGLPAYFKISGIDITTDKIHAVFNSEGRLDNIDLSYDEEADLWKMPRVTNIFMQHKQFQIYCNDMPISPTRYKVTDFIALNPNDYKEIKFNSFGEYDDKGNFDGLSLRLQNDVNWTSIQNSMRKDGQPIPKTKSEYTPSDFLLYYLSTRPRCERKEFLKIIDVLIQNKIFELDWNKKWSVRSLIDNYFRLGYINYSYIEGKHIIAVNRPSLLLIPPQTKRQKLSGTRITMIKHKESFWTAMLTGARTPHDMKTFLNVAKSFALNNDRLSVEVVPSVDGLLPQSIYVRAYNLDTIVEFAKRNNYLFQKCIYSNTLLHSLSSVSEYISHITQHESYDRYDGISNLVRVDYTKLSEDGIYRRLNTFSKEKSVVTYFPGTFREQTIFWEYGKQYSTDKHWGHLIGMAIEHAKVIKINSETNVLELPIMLQLPQLYARALTLVSGKIPVEEGSTRSYEIYENPFIGASDRTFILQKLSQN